MMLHKLRRAMVAPEREALEGEVEVDEFYLGGPEGGLGGRERLKKTPVGVAIEVAATAPDACACRCSPTSRVTRCSDSCNRP